MFKVKRLVYVLLLIGLATMVVYSDETTSNYVSPSEAVPRGKASKDASSIAEPWRTYKTICSHLLPG